MKKNLLFLLLIMFSFQTADIRAEHNESILFERLANDPWFDHVRAWDTLFAIEQIDQFLELSEGKATRFFLDKCTHVTSVSLITISTADQIFPVYYASLDLFDGLPNWTPKLHIFSEITDKANQYAEMGQNPDMAGEEYLKEINQFCMELTEDTHYDAIFVDPRLCIRGDIMNALFNHADIIATHDTNYVPNIYGWYKLAAPENYEELHFSYGSGTTFWIKKDKEDLIKKLKLYAG